MRIRCLAVVLLLYGFPLVAQKTSGPQTAENFYQQGLAALQRHNLPTAEADFKQAIRLSPAHANARNSLGWIFLSQREFPAAIAEFRVAIKLKPTLARAHLNLSSALTQEGSLEEALSEGRFAVRLAPNDSQAHRNLGRILSFRKGSGWRHC